MVQNQPLLRLDSGPTSSSTIVSNKQWLLHLVHLGCNKSVYEGKDVYVY